jgi:fructose-1,6-bisphosphatase/inositol monophosphatase family enzyme
LAVLSEESGLQGEAAVTVVVDPVDGSTNASRGLPWYAASVAAVDADGPLASLVVNLATGVRYRAIRDRGAFRDRSPIMVGGAETGTGDTFGAGVRIQPAPTTELKSAIVAMSGYPPARGGWAQYRCQGAAALDLCCVADGRLDAYFDVNAAHGVWDYAGALLVCREAGAPMVAAGGLDLLVLDHRQRRGPVAAATPELLMQVQALLATWKQDR